MGQPERGGDAEDVRTDLPHFDLAESGNLCEMNGNLAHANAEIVVT
jgi:hypothetical protein